MWPFLRMMNRGLLRPKLSEGHPAHDDEGEDDAGEHAADREEARLEEEEAAHLAALHPYRAHRADLADALVHDDAEGVHDPHHDDEEEYEQDDEAGRVEDVDDLLHLREHVVEGEHPVLDRPTRSPSWTWFIMARTKFSLLVRDGPGRRPGPSCAGSRRGRCRTCPCP